VARSLSTYRYQARRHARQNPNQMWVIESIAGGLRLTPTAHRSVEQPWPRSPVASRSGRSPGHRRD
jgi:hypothetical protein